MTDQPSVKKKRRAPAALVLDCDVCSAPAPDHLHFGGHCCYSCRAFFRRTIERMVKIDVVCRTGEKMCEVTENSKSCSACRFQKCLDIGMKTELLQGKRKTESSTFKTETKKKKRPHQKRSLTSSSLEGGKSTKIIKRPDYVKTSVIQSTHPQHCHDYSQRASLVKSVNTTLEEMYQDYVGEQAPGSNEVSVIVLDRPSTVEQKSLKQSFTPDDVHQVPRIQNQVITEANNLLDTCSFNKIFDNIYNFNHQGFAVNRKFQ